MKTAQLPSTYPLRAFPAFPSLEVPAAHSARWLLVTNGARPELFLAFEPEHTPLAAYEMLVSAACYLALAPAGDAASTLEASQILHKLSEQMLETPQGEASRLIWTRKQSSWERYGQVEAAIRYVKAAGEFRRAAARRQPRSKLARWWSTWLGMSQVHPF